MERTPIVSSTIVSVGYDAATRRMEIEFVGGRIYHYSELPEDVYEELVAADSAGSFFNTRIRGRYPFGKVE